VQAAMLTFEDIRSTLPPPKGKGAAKDAKPEPRVILSGVTGKATPGRLLAVRCAALRLQFPAGAALFALLLSLL
jgi:hypothetical protein